MSTLYSKYTVGWSDFGEKTIGHLHCCDKLYQDPNSKILLFNGAFRLIAGSQNLLANTFYEQNNKFFITLFKLAIGGRGGNVFLDNFYFSSDQVKNSLAHFRDLKKYNNKIYFLFPFSLSKEGICKFKIKSFLRFQESNC